MFKKRPRATRPAAGSNLPPNQPAKTEAAYWRPRLFKNTYTYKGRQYQVNSWAVKMQLFGRRKTFSLSCRDPVQAADEASQIYQAILAHGWAAVPRRPGAGLPSAARGMDDAPPLESDLTSDSWKHRLIHRRYPEQAAPVSQREFSVRIQYAGMSRFFPLGTTDETEAAQRAERIFQTVANEGWACATERFPVELTLGLRWLDNPIAWTYTTLHSRHNAPPRRPAIAQTGQPASVTVAILEPDASIRFALTACVGSQEGFRCAATFTNPTEAIQEIQRQAVDFILINSALPNQSGADCAQELQRARPALVSLIYSVFEDSNDLFLNTPGGGVGYLLRRTPAIRLFEPLASPAGRFSREWLTNRVREYFQQLVAALPAPPSALELAKLTPREHQILTLLSQSALAKEIADTLGISIWTVNGHIKSIFEKLGVHSRTEAVVKFLQK